MDLLDVIRGLSSYDDDATIYVRPDQPTTASSEALVAQEAEDGTPPEEAAGMRYLLEVSLAKEAIRVWREWRAGRQPSLDEACAAVVHYATHDAYLPVDG